MRTEAQPNSFDAMEDVLRDRKMAVNEAEYRLGQHSSTIMADPTALASRLDRYRRSGNVMKSANHETRRLLSPGRQGAQPFASKLKQPQQYLHQYPSATAAHDGVPANGFEGLPVAEPASNGGGVQDAVAAGEMSFERLGQDASRDETITMLNRALRSKNARIRVLESENERYREMVDTFGEHMDEIKGDNTHTDQKVGQLAQELEDEKRSHEKARQGLEMKAREVEDVQRRLEDQVASLQERNQEVERQRNRLAELEHLSAAAHQENMELSRRMEEMNRLAAEREYVAGAGGGGVEEEGGEGVDAAQRELKELKHILEMKTRKLEAVTERASKAHTELQWFKGQARTGLFRRLILKLWLLLRAVGFVSFVLFVLIIVSQDASRSHGFDVRRLAH